MMSANNDKSFVIAAGVFIVTSLVVYGLMFF